MSQEFGVQLGHLVETDEFFGQLTGVLDVDPAKKAGTRHRSIHVDGDVSDQRDQISDYQEGLLRHLVASVKES